MKYHFIGDQGISMRGLKAYMAHLGHKVSGSDLKTSGHGQDNITADIDVVVKTSAVSPGSPGWVEVEAAEKLGKKVIKRSELLGQITDNKRLIAISGMHGKTTVTSMAGLVMIAAGLDPTVLVGDEVRDFDGVLRIGNSDWFVAEACEYDRSFLDLHPEILILTNIEEEHLDTYPGGLSEIKETFIQYIGKIREGGVVIACFDDENVRDVIESSDTKARIIYYGFGSKSYNHLDFQLSIPGKHNIQNALGVLALADYLGIRNEAAEDALRNFKGANRRFEYKGEWHGASIIDDYGHHPTEIRSTIQALGERYPDKKKIVVFWPHQYKRIMPLLDKFATAFQDADEVILKPIYFVPGRDEVLPISSEDLAKKVGNKAMVMNTDEEIIQYLKEKLDDNSVVLTIGIPPVYRIAEELVRG